MSFHLFRSDECTHIPGRKEQTVDKAVEIFNPRYVYVPAVDSRGGLLNSLAEEGKVVKKGTLLGLRAPDDFPIYSPVSGTITARKKMMTAYGKEMECLEIENDLEDQWVELVPPKLETNDDIINAIKASGVIGFGGAGFPTYRKYNSGKPVDYLIVNAIECEPYLTTDYIFSSADEEVEYLFKSLPYLLKVSGAKEVAFCTKDDKPLLIEACKKFQAKYPELPVKLYLSKDRYPMGYERNLVTLVTNKEYGMIPIEAGCIVDNIYTFICLGKYFTEGKIADLRCITVAGDVKDPKNVLTPYGVLSDDLIEFCGGATIDEYKVINGGPLNGNSIDVNFATLLQTNGLLVLKPNKFAEEPCWHCGACCENCPMDLQPVQIQMAYKRNDLQRMKELNADRCCGCGLCSYMCPSRIEVSQNVMKAKALVLQALREGK